MNMKRNLKLLALTILGSWMAGDVLAEEHYVVGNATASGWNTGESQRSPVAMMKVSDNIWIWTGKITGGDNRFRIPDGGWGGLWATTNGDLLGSEEKPLKNNQDEGDYSFRVAEDGIYKVTLNTSTTKIKAEKLEEPAKDGDYYQIATVADYYWLAGAVTSGEVNYKAKLTSDLDFSTDGFFPLSCDKYRFEGEFDGAGHTMSNISIEGSYNNLAFFRSINGATIKNLKVEGSITTDRYQMGGLVSVSRGASVIQNVVVATNMASSHSGDGTHGGFIAVAYDVPTIQNVAFVGSINAPADYGTCGVIGYAHSGGSIHYTNCFVGGTLTLTGDNNRVFGRNGEYCDNCYTTLTSMTKLNDANRFNGADVSASQVESGELAYLLNGSVSGATTWYQAIGTDAYPTPFGTAVVYANGYLYCDGMPKPGSIFENEEKASIRDAHHYSDKGFCDNKHDDITCDEIQSGFASLTDGYYQLGNAKELNWFAEWTARKDASVNAKLTANIDMTEVTNFSGIGTDANRFTGTIDGQRHIISNLTMNVENGTGVGLVNTAADGATLKNLTIASNCTFTGKNAVAALIGAIRGSGNIYIQNCGNEGSIMATNANAGGIVGCRYDNSTVHLTNVYNVGTITGTLAGESGSISGWLSNAVLKNCYSIAGYPTSGNTHGFQEGNQFSRGNGINLENCYDYGTGLWGQNESTWGYAFADGRKITDPNDETQMGAMFAGLYDAEGGDVWRMEYEGWAHPVLYDPAKKVLSENVPNRFSSENGVDLTLKRTTVADTWNTICLPFALNATQIASLFGAGAKVAELAGATGETLNFTSVTSTEAGKAYLVMPSEAMSEKELTVDLDATAPVATTEGGYAFTGIYEPTAVVANDLFVAAGNKLTPSDGTGNLKAFRAYFHNTGSGARLTNFVIDEETTGIASIEDGLLKVQDAVYDMQGRKVSQLKKGLYIVNGKKQVVK